MSTYLPTYYYRDPAYKEPYQPRSLSSACSSVSSSTVIINLAGSYAAAELELELKLEEAAIFWL